MACRGGAESVLVRAFKPVDVGADARRIQRRPLLYVDGVHVLNLKRREDRWDAVRAATARASRRPGRARVDAVDGATLDVAAEDVKRVFNLTSWRYGGAKNCHQDHGYRSRVIGCALSHLKAWRLISEDDDAHALHLILEDDVEFAGDFAERWAELGRRLKADYSWDLVHLGVLDDRNLYDDSPVEGVPGARRFSAAQRSFGAGAFAYVIRPRTARWLLAKAYDAASSRPSTGGSSSASANWSPTRRRPSSRRRPITDCARISDTAKDLLTASCWTRTSTTTRTRRSSTRSGRDPGARVTGHFRA